MDWTFKPALLLMLGRGLGFAATFFIPVVLVRVFEPADFGTYKQLFLIFTTLYLIAQLGMAESLYYFLPVAREKGGGYVVNSLLTLAATGLACLLAVSLMDVKLSGWLNNPQLGGYLSLIGLHLFLMLASAVLEISLISRKRYGLAVFCYIFSDLARAGLLILPALLWTSLQAVLVGAVIFSLIRVLAVLLYLRGEWGATRPDSGLLKQQLAYALPFQMAIVMEILQSNFHQYAVAYYFEPAVFAVYAVGCLQIPLVDFAASSAGNVLMVGLREASQKDDRQMMLKIWHDTTRKLALLFFPLVALLQITAEDLIVFLFTETYLQSVPVFMVWVMFVLVAVVQTDAVLRVYAQTRFLFFLYSFKFGLILVLVGLFLSAFDLIGAVLVTLFSALTAKLLALGRIKRLMGVRLRELLPWGGLLQIAVVALAAGPPALLIRSALGVSLLPLLLIVGIFYAGFYFVFLVAGRVLTEGERSALLAWLNRAASFPWRARNKELKV